MGISLAAGPVAAGPNLQPVRTIVSIHKYIYGNDED
jgi:hypothetical protein